MKLKSEISRLLLAGGSVLALDPTLAFAQAATADGSSLEEIVVTASKRAEDLQDVPFAVSAVTGAVMEQRGLNNLDQISKFVPSLRWVPASTPRNSGVFMRGIGQNGTNQGIEPSVGVFLDGVYLPIPGPLQTQLRDIDSIEVLRGPQGTLYGRNTPIGAININTRAPTQTNEASLTASYGNYNDMQLSGYVGGGLGETLSGRLSGWIGDRDGYEKNLATGQDINWTDQYGVRGRLKWEPSSTVTANFIGYYTRMKSLIGAPEQLDINQLTKDPITLFPPPAPPLPNDFLANSAALGTPYQNFKSGDHKVEEFSDGRDIMEIAGASAQFDVDLGDLGTLTSITAYSWIHDDAPMPPYAGLARATLNDQGAVTERTGWTQELRLASPTDRTVTYLAGIYLFKDDVDYDNWLVVGPGANRVVPVPVPGVGVVPLTLKVGDNYTYLFKQTTESYAGFGQLGWHVTDNFELIGGLRYSHDNKNADSITTVDPASSTLFKATFKSNALKNQEYSDGTLTYSATARYSFNDDVMMYLTYSTGTKSGGFNAAPLAPGTPTSFDAENSDSIELGLKSTLLDGRMTLNVDVYRLNLDDFQDATVNPNGSGFIVGNAGDRRTQGVELDARFLPFEGFTIGMSLAYLDAEYTRYPDGQCYLGQKPDGSKPNTCDYKGKTPYHSPEWMGSLAADYRHNLGSVVGFVGGDYAYTSEENTLATLDPRSIQDAVGLLGARFGIESEDGSWRVTAYGKNLTDESYYTASTGLILAPFIGAAAPGATPPALYAQANGLVGWYAPPRTYGVEVTYNF